LLHEQRGEKERRHRSARRDGKQQADHGQRQRQANRERDAPRPEWRRDGKHGAQARGQKQRGEEHAHGMARGNPTRMAWVKRTSWPPIHGPRTRRTIATAIRRGTNATVCSWIWVAACTKPTTSPLSRLTRTTGATRSNARNIPCRKIESANSIRCIPG